MTFFTKWPLYYQNDRYQNEIHQRQRVITNMTVVELSKNNRHFERHFFRFWVRGMAGVKDRSERKNSTNLTLIEHFRAEKK